MPDGSILRCLWCESLVLEDEPIQWIPHLGDSGPAVPKPWHVECFWRSIMGGLNHLNGTCTCCGGTNPPDPPHMTRREAAVAAFKFYAQYPVTADRNIRRAMRDQ